MVFVLVSSRLGDEIALIFAKPLLWHAMGHPDRLPHFPRMRITETHRGADNDLAEDVNPAERIQVMIIGNEGCININDLPREFQQNGDGTSRAHGQTVSPFTLRKSPRPLPNHEYLKLSKPIPSPFCQKRKCPRSPYTFGTTAPHF